ncbi:MAG TPA: hypothetical protein VGX00_02640 [Thermoplasmata archaeon]|nr:hypothetical protein [Thermoplasmata archaeon]
MSATTRGLSSGVILGVVLVLLGQQFGLFDMSELSNALIYLIVGAVAFGVLGGLVGARLGRRNIARVPPKTPDPSG